MDTPFDVQDIEKGLAKLSDWEVSADGTKISKAFKTGSFIAGVAFIAKITELAEEAKHHPDVELSYERVVIHLSTHDAGGVTEKDLDLAESIDAIPPSFNARIG